MSEYKVINRFKETQHGGHIYEVGDIYPVEGKRLNKARADELTKVHPIYNHAFLTAVQKPDEKKVSKAPATNTEKSDE